MAMDMDDNDHLQRQPHDLSETNKQSLTASQKTLAVELHLTAANSKTELDPSLVAEFSRKFFREPPEAIRSAFQSWRDQSPHIPTISDILRLLATWHRDRAEAAAEAQQKRERAELEVARAEGKLADFADIKKQLLEIAKMPEPTSRQVEMRIAIEKMQRAEMPPALQLTKEQIAARREKELEEIRNAERES
jgi:hypothetical protein